MFRFIGGRMGVLQLVLLVLKLCIVHGSAGVILSSPVASTPHDSALVPQAITVLIPSKSPSPPHVTPTDELAPSTQTVPEVVAPTPQTMAFERAPITVPHAQVPVASPPRKITEIQPPVPPYKPGVAPMASPPRKVLEIPPPVPHDQVPVASPPRKDPEIPPPLPHAQVPVESSPRKSPKIPPVIRPSGPEASPIVSEAVSPISAPPPRTSRKEYRIPVAGVSPPYKSAPVPQTIEAQTPSTPLSPLITPIDTSVLVPSTQLIPPLVAPTVKSAPLSKNVAKIVPPTPRSVSPERAPNIEPLIPVPQGQAPVVSPPKTIPEIPLPVNPPQPGVAPIVSVPPPRTSKKENEVPVSPPPKDTSNNRSPMNHPPRKEHSLAPIASSPTMVLEKPVAVHPPIPGVAPSMLSDPAVSPTTPPPSNLKDYETPVSAPPKEVFHDLSPGNDPSVKEPDVSPISSPPPSISKKVHGMPIMPPPKDTSHQSPSSHSPTKEHAVSPKSAPPPSVSKKEYAMPVAAPPKQNIRKLSPMTHSPLQGHSPMMARPPPKARKPSNMGPTPSTLPPKYEKKKWAPSPASLPAAPFYKHHHTSKRVTNPGLAPSHSDISPTSPHQVRVIPVTPVHSPAAAPKKSRLRHPHPPPLLPGLISPIRPPLPSTVMTHSPAPSPSPTTAISSARTKGPVFHPLISPPNKPKRSPPSPVQVLPPPPPNQDCLFLTCYGPYTNSPPGAPCGCVIPIKIELRLGVALYTFFPLVSELAVEIANGVFMKLSQVRIMGANAATQQLEKTDVLIDLVPLGEMFDNTTAFLTYQRFWHKQVAINTSLFGDYEVLYVTYPGLPPSPPSAASSITIIDGVPYANGGNNARTMHPLGVDVSRKKKGGLSGSIIAIIVLSSFAAMTLFIGAAWFLLPKCRDHRDAVAKTPRNSIPSLAKQSGAAGSTILGSGMSSASLSFGSSITTYAGTAKTFSADEIVRATDNFDDSRILGEGGFGRVYRGFLDDGKEVAVKVLKRDDQQGGREFLAEVEMLSRLHHRNLVKLIGICVEDQSRCLVYELIPNGSVESHLHGDDKETAPLDWGARMKIALGAARGLAYLHEDSSPHVIHRDFKSSNILLDHDFTPKVSDFGLARSALEEGNRHISTRVMGTFGYVAPEYAMTGHLLVKSDVYSYGVVLLELLTGRKPVDMSQPEGQENLVAWARPLLTSKEGLEIMIDPALGSSFSFDNVAKVAAIASMCVQPEVSHRPFMGEVVQALKLVCNESDETKLGSSSCSQEYASVIDIDTKTNTGSGHLLGASRAHYSEYDSSPENDGGLSASDIFTTSRFGRQFSGSFRRHSSSGPLRPGRNRQFWQRVRGYSRGSISEHGFAYRLWGESH